MITSPQNSRLKLVRNLLRRSKTRAQEGRVVLEGFRLVQDVYQQGYSPDFVLHKDGIENSLLPELRENGVPCLPVEPHLFERISATEHSQGFLAVFPVPEKALPEDATLLLALDGIREPGNAGTILRSAAAAGVDGVILLPGTVDIFNARALRAGMGAHFRVPVHTMVPEALIADFGAGWHIRAAMIEAQARSCYQVNWRRPAVLVIGSEAHGISSVIRRGAHESVYIPMSSGVESLNAAMATAVLLFEIRRQRDCG